MVRPSYILFRRGDVDGDLHEWHDIPSERRDAGDASSRGSAASRLIAIFYFYHQTMNDNLTSFNLLDNRDNTLPVYSAQIYPHESLLHQVQAANAWHDFSHPEAMLKLKKHFMANRKEFTFAPAVSISTSSSSIGMEL